jgi:hypothetical protein
MNRIVLASVVAGAAVAGVCMFPTMSFAGTVAGEQYPYWTAGKVHLAHDAYARFGERKALHARPRLARVCSCEAPGQVGDPRGQWEDYPGWRWNGDPRWQWDGYPRWLWHG